MSIHRPGLDVLIGVAAGLVGFPVAVTCQSGGAAFVDAGSEAGYVRFEPGGRPERRTLIKHEQCAALQQYISAGHRAPSAGEAVAVHVLTHEAMHVAGQVSESAAECEAVQRDAVTALALGASEPAARRLAHLLAGRLPHASPGLPDVECAPSRSLDERLPSPRGCRCANGSRAADR